MFTSDMTAGRGFIAIAAIYCGQGKPVQSSLYAILFGVARSLAVNLSGICRTGSRNVRYNSIYHHGSGACSCFIYEI